MSLNRSLLNRLPHLNRLLCHNGEGVLLHLINDSDLSISLNPRLFKRSSLLSNGILIEDLDVLDCVTEASLFSEHAPDLSVEIGHVSRLVNVDDLCLLLISARGRDGDLDLEDVGIR